MTLRRILFVCLGNICRSPTAEGVTRAMIVARGLDIEVDSAGTGRWHIGKPPHGPMTRAAAEAGYDLSSLRARVFGPRDFAEFDVIYAMDMQNLRDIEALRPAAHETDGHGRPGHETPAHATPVRLFRSHDPEGGTDVPDPYFEGNYADVVRLVERTAARLLDSAAGGRSHPR